MARAGLALALANVRYWGTVAPLLRRELSHWRRRALRITDPGLRRLALCKLDAESFNAEAAGMLATLAPRANRGDAVRAIVAIEVLFDLLDGVTERPLGDPLRDGEEQFAVFTGALSGTQGAAPPHGCDGGYLAELSRAAGDAFQRLPGARAVRDTALACAERAAQAQIRMHAVPLLGTGPLEEWAKANAAGAGLPWRELLAGSASSVLALHALIAAAADPATTARRAEQLDRCYLSICVLVTLLDGVLDQSEDARSGRFGYIGLFQSPQLLARALNGALARAAGQARALSDAPAHLVILTGAVAYYATAPGAAGTLLCPLDVEIRRGLRPLLSPTLAVLRTWRLARAIRDRR
jgi:tetraprenyl-beta-curcumene synthase